MTVRSNRRRDSRRFHYFFVSRTSQLPALLAVFLDVGICGGARAPLMATALLFTSSLAVYVYVLIGTPWIPS